MLKLRSKEKYLELIARIGLSAKGLVYSLLALLAVLSAFGLAKHKQNKEETFKMVNEQPFGQVILAIIGLSLLGYVMLRCFEVVKGKQDEEKGWERFIFRLGYALSAVIYAGISYLALKMAFGNGGEDHTKETYLQKLLQSETGRVAAVIAGIIILLQGVYHVYKGFSKKFMKRVSLYHSEFKRSFTIIGVVGYVARGVVLLLVGYSVCRAGIDANAKEAKGTESAFEFLQNYFGSWLMIVLALGLLAYGIFMFVKARHEKLNL